MKLLTKGILLFIFLHWLYFNDPLFSGPWFQQVGNQLLINAELLFRGEWTAVTPAFRGLLLLALIWLISYLLYHWFVEAKRIFLFVLFTVIYLAVLDTFTAYPGAVPVVRTFILSFMALALAHLLKEFEKESIRFTWKKIIPLKWFLPVAFVILFSVLIGFVAPKMEPQWPDPVPFIEQAIDDAAEPGTDVQKVGYGEDDSELGGAFIQDNTPIFQATVQDDHYWRGEAKDTYTGKGWIHSREDEEIQQTGGHISLNLFSDRVETTERQATVNLQPEVETDYIFYPYGMKTIHSLSNAQVMLGSESDALRAWLDGAPTHLSSYDLEYEQPSYEISQLMSENEQDPASIKERYTQLPDELPGRVADLAEEITAPYETRYEKAKAVEQYFNSSGFTYQTTDVPVPGQDEDYVDQFLFESQAGYCDNFSTSMVVLLRTLDIPARWVKGFTAGEFIESENGYQTYQVTNANAHSWAEVYFPEVGWVPFEPTQGFSNLADLQMDVEPEQEQQLEEIDQPEPEREEEEVREAEDEQQEMRAVEGMNINWWFIGISIAVLAALGTILYLLRFRLQRKWHQHRLSERFDEKNFQEAYHFLLKLLQSKGIEKKPEQTLREFAKVVDTTYDTEAMSRLTVYYEKVLYKKGKEQLPETEVVELWEEAANAISGLT
jgi:transglutaminase-like putative cysteine protease